jgi:hypothetical protein
MLAPLDPHTQNNDPSTFGIAIFSAESEETARSIMNNNQQSSGA